MKRPLVTALALVAVAAGVGLGVSLAGFPPGTAPVPSGVALGSPGTTGPASPTMAPTPPPTPVAATPRPTPEPTPRLVAAPLTGRPVTDAVAAQHPIAVMVDDHGDARPQSGFNAAAVVWHAPAEGGVPRYMLVYQDTMPVAVGPVRSARQYYVEWAAEWRAMYVHVGGSPGSLATLRERGSGQLVWNADEYRWGGGPGYLWRLRERFAPHNVYSDGEHLRALAARLGATDGPMEPAWRFAADAPIERRPYGGRIEAPFPRNEVGYDYDRATNTYRRRVSGETPQVDAADGEVVAPKNVIVMLVEFGPLDDGHPEKQRLEARIVGTGPAWIATNGRTIKATWRKDAITAPTRFFDAEGRPVTLTIGQTCIQVLDTGSKVTVADGTSPDRRPGPGGS